MASKVSGVIEQIKVDSGDNQAIASTAYGYCTTAANIPTKTVEMTGFQLVDGVTVYIKFENENISASPTLNINGTGEKAIYIGNISVDCNGNIIGWRADDIVAFTYDADSQKWIINTSAYAAQAGSILSGNVKPIISKTYTGVNVTSNTDPDGWLYFFKACATGSYNDIWRITYKITAECAGRPEGKSVSIIHIDGVRNTYVTYWVWNSISNTSYYPYYAHATYWRSANNTTVINEYAPIFGLRFQSSYAPTDSTYARTITFDIIEMEKCQVTFFNNGLLYNDVSGTGSTYFSSRASFNGTTQGMTMSGDRNDTAQYVSTNGFKGQVGANKIGRYTLFLKTGDGKYESLTQQVNTTAATKTRNTNGFLPEGKIYYNPNNTDYNAGTLNFSPYEQYHALDYRYSFNLANTTLPDYCETYIKYTYDPSDGLLYLAENWIATALPTTADGFIYQRIGSKYYTGTSNYYQGSVLLNNPYYEYSNDSLHTWFSYAAHADTATTASKLTTSNLGSNIKPIYLVAGVATECKTYAGGTKVTLNASDKSEDDASFYAPTSSGAAGNVLISAGNSAPNWYTGLSLTGSGTANDPYSATFSNSVTVNNKLYIGSNTSYGDAYTPIYWNDGIPTAVTSIQKVAFTINNGKSGVQLSNTAFTADSYVTEIVVESGISYLKGSLSWTSDSGKITLTSSTTTGGAVSGYIVVSRGGNITPTSTQVS